jgi:nuclear transport factor 2 (NTF2) superfamily protein
MTAISKPPFAHEVALAKARTTENVSNSSDPKYRLNKALWFAGNALISRVAREMSQYHLWLQRAGKPW